MPLSTRLVTCMILCFITMIPVRTFTQEMPLKVAKEPAKHSISRAAIFSAVLPGLGQAYNKKYWKIPVIYVGFGAIGYFIITNNNEFLLFKEAYIYVANGETYPTGNPYVTKYKSPQLLEAMDYYRRNRDLSIIIGALWYTLNILEAYVDAHFFSYDISEDISMHVGPAAVSIPTIPVQPAPGIKVSFKF
ncbi:MAG: DUF5683 domain-containing protein [Bacteroidales bacterium]|nr:DUF5683 domain-containing protein [Bacteroidales bacterium]